MSYFVKGQLKPDQNESMLDEMTIILFHVLWKIVENEFHEQQHYYRQILHEAEAPELENALRRDWEKAKEVAEKEKSDRARVKVQRKNIIMVCSVFSYDLPIGLSFLQLLHFWLKFDFGVVYAGTFIWMIFWIIMQIIIILNSKFLFNYIYCCLIYIKLYMSELGIWIDFSIRRCSFDLCLLLMFQAAAWYISQLLVDH